MTSSIAKKLALLAKLRGLTQANIANQCKISRISVNRFFTEKTELKAGDLLNLMRVLGIEVETELDIEIQCTLEGREKNTGAVDSDIVDVIHNLDQSVQKTLLEQISWWGISSNNKDITEACQRIKEFSKEMRM